MKLLCKIFGCKLADKHDHPKWFTFRGESLLYCFRCGALHGYDNRLRTYYFYSAKTVALEGGAVEEGF